VSEEGVECDADTIVDARDWQEPKSKTELKSDLGFCGYFRKFKTFFPIQVSQHIFYQSLEQCTRIG
jgi:hypothetical protein